MSQAVRDLPDPLDPSPSLSTSDPDDLLAKMADEAIDRLIADADNGRPPVSVPPTVDPLSADPPAAEGEIEEEEGPTYPAASTAPGMVADNRIVAVNPAEPRPTDLVQPAEATAVAPSAEREAADPTPPDAILETPASADAPAPIAEQVPHRAADREVLLAEPAERPSVLLLPLRLLNWPFAWIGDNARRVFGLIGIVTLVPAIAAIVYVLWLKQHWGG